MANIISVRQAIALALALSYILIAVASLYQLQALCDVLDGTAAPLTGGADAIGNMATIDAIYEKAGFR